MATSDANRATVAGALAVAVLALPACSTTAPQLALQGDEPFVLRGVSNVEQVGQVTGAESPGSTDRWAVNHSDLGSMFEADGKVWFVFGDTFGERDPDFTGGGGSFWRSNTLGFTTDDDPADGITIEGMVLDETSAAAEVLPSKKVDHDEMTVIPTHGFAANDAMYLHWMSVNHWGEPGEWEVNEAGLSKSSDGGQTWASLDEPRWSGDSRFVQISPYTVTEDGVERLYVWGVTHGRFGGVGLARVETAKLEASDAWQYFTGTDAAGAPQWADDPDAATLVVDGTVGELSVVWNPYLERWIMSTLAEGRGIELREGITPWGPWSEPHLMIAQSELPGPYAPYMLDRYTADGGRTIYFTLSVWDPYNVFWYRADLDKG